METRGNYKAYLQDAFLFIGHPCSASSGWNLINIILEELGREKTFALIREILLEEKMLTTALK